MTARNESNTGRARVRPRRSGRATALVSSVTIALCAACGKSSDAEADAAAVADASPDADVRPGTLELVGHSPLLDRGMNSSLAIVGDHVYVGSRTDGVTHDDAGVLIVDVSDPATPEVVGQIGPPDEALRGMSSRELRAIPDQNLLIVLNFHCSYDVHDCLLNPELTETGGAAETDNLKFYDVTDPTAPELVATHDFGTHPMSAETKPHEFFLWRDPADPGRVLLYVATPLGPPALKVLDVSDPGAIELVATFDPEDDAGLPEPRGDQALLHSVTVSADGRTAFISYQSAGVLFADTSDLAEGVAEPEIRMLTPVDARVDYTPPQPSGPHSAVEIPGRDLILVTDEVYPEPYFAGCPWGWARLVDYSDTDAPFVAGEFKLPENEESFCEGTFHEDVSYTSHNTTVTEHLALATWHSGGLQVFDTSDPTNPVGLDSFSPQPIDGVVTEDPVLGGDPVLMWSYPIVEDGLIYVVDIRNGLYVLRYTGRHEHELDVPFLEGNSNLR